MLRYTCQIDIKCNALIVQGIYPAHAGITDVNSCHAVPEVGVLATGDDFGKVNLFRYPSLDPGAVRLEYAAHAGCVTTARFTYNRRHLISLGGSDCSILIWKHELEELESSDDEELVSPDGQSAKSPVHTSDEDDPTQMSHRIDLKFEIGDVGDRTDLQEAVNRQQSTQELIDLVKAEYEDEFVAVKPWKGHIVEPTFWREKMLEENPHQSVDGTTDVDLELNWVHGYRSHDCRNNVRYNAAGDIVYFVATLGTVLSKPTGRQRFLQGAHTDDVIGMAAHPAGQIFATGEAGRNPVIIVWNSENMSSLSRLRGAHSRGVSLLAFNTNGNYLASVGLDGESSLAIHEWKKGTLVMKTSTSKGRVLCVTFLMSSTDGRDTVVTGGEQHLTFWWWLGQNAKSQKCIWNKARKKVGNRVILPDILTVASASTDVVLAGSTRGKLLIFSKHRYVGSPENGTSPHRAAKSPIQCMWCRMGDIDDGKNLPIYVTGDKVGNVVVWMMKRFPNEEEMILEKFKEFNIAELKIRHSPSRSLPERGPTSVSVRSVCEREGIMLLGTEGGEIFEIPCVLNRKESPMDEPTLDVHVFPEECQLLVSGCGKGEVWGLQCHPTLPVYFTSGDDGTIRCWSVENHRMVFLHQLEGEKSRSVALRPTSSHLAVACNSGKVKIFSYRVEGDQLLEWNEISGAEALRPTARIIEVIMYSFDGSILAVGSHDSNIYLYYAEDTAEGLQHALAHTMTGHSGRLRSMDFGIILEAGETIQTRCAQGTQAVAGNPGKRKIEKSDIILQSNCTSFELRFWTGDGKEVRSVSAVRNTTWTTFNCTLGWPVQGIWPPHNDGAVVNACCRSNSWKTVPVLATGDNYGRVRLFNYPATKPGAPDKCYRGHSKNIRNIDFSYNDAYCISTGGDDHSIFVWGTDIMEEIREREALATEERAFKLLQRPTDPIELTKRKQLPVISESDSVVARDRYYGEDTEEAMAEGGLWGDDDAFDGSITENSRRRIFGDESIVSKPWKGSIREPSTYSESDHDGAIPQASLELTYVYGYRGWDCRNNIGFADSVYEVVYHVAAVGIVLNTSNNTQIHNTEHEDDILCLDVHPDGHTVATGAIGRKPKLVLWDANTGVTLRAILFHQRGISNVSFTSDGSHIVSVGMDIDGIVAVHKCATGVIIGSGKIGRGVLINVLAFCGTDTFITGGNMHMKFWDMSNKSGGRVELMSKGGLFGKQSQSKNVISAAYLGTDAVTGMGDGTLLLWKGRSNTRTHRAHQGAVTTMESIAASNSGASTGNGDTGPRILTGGIDGMVYLWNSQLICMWEFNLKNWDVYSLQVQALAYREGQLLVGTKASEILQISMLANEVEKLVSGHFIDKGEVWGLATHPLRETFTTAGDDMTVRVWDSKTCKLKHIARAKNKVRAVEYSPDGFQLALGLYDGRVVVLTEDLELTLSESPVANEWIQTMAYAPNGHSLAVGSHDCNIYILETKNYNIRCVCRGHPLSISQLDFSACSTRLHSVSGAFDLLFWDTDTGDMITSATSMRDVKWARWTCTVGWPVQV